MEYIINSISQEGEIVTTNTTITLDTGTVITVDIAHFLPNSFDDINQGIINRALSEQKKIDALYQGADDFLNKPYEVSELVARIFSLLRRSKLSSKNIIRYNELQIDLLAKSVLVNEVLLGLTKKEFELLVFFLEHKNKVVTKDALLTYLSGQLEDSKSNADIIYAHIKNLKRKMNDAGCKIYLNTIYGIGYKWED